MNDEFIKDLDNDSLVELLTELEGLNNECDERISEMMGDNNG